MNYELQITKNKNSGYTIIETMIAVSLFIIIVMAGMGALLNANLLHQKSQSMRSILDTINFAMEDMSRNLRTGITYHCVDNGNITLTNAHSCANGGGISFKPASGGNQWVYYIGINPNNSTYSLFKSVDGVVVQLTPDEIAISPTASGFSVLGAEPPTGNLQQPLVTIRLVGTITLNHASTSFSLQTSVSQRLIDL